MFHSLKCCRRGLVADPLIFGNLNIRGTSMDVAKGVLILLVSHLSFTWHCILYHFYFLFFALIFVTILMNLVMAVLNWISWCSIAFYVVLDMTKAKV